VANVSTGGAGKRPGVGVGDLIVVLAKVGEAQTLANRLDDLAAGAFAAATCSIEPSYSSPRVSAVGSSIEDHWHKSINTTIATNTMTILQPFQPKQLVSDDPC
jgi:hypothetical protein